MESASEHYHLLLCLFYTYISKPSNLLMSNWLKQALLVTASPFSSPHVYATLTTTL